MRQNGLSRFVVARCQTRRLVAPRSFVLVPAASQQGPHLVHILKLHGDINVPRSRVFSRRERPANRSDNFQRQYCFPDAADEFDFKKLVSAGLREPIGGRLQRTRYRAAAAQLCARAWPRFFNSNFTSARRRLRGFTAFEPAGRPIGEVPVKTAFGRLMLRTSADLQIDAAHARAICDEIGDRLRDMLRRQLGAELPPRLRHLMAQLEKLDDETSPSIVPSLDDMVSRQEPNAPGRKAIAISMLESA